MTQNQSRVTSQTQASQRRFRVRPAYLMLLAVMALFTWRFVVKTQEIHALARQESALRSQNEQTARENARLRESIGYYRTPDFVEEQARAIFGETRPGDKLVQSQPVEQRPVTATSAAPARAAAPPDPTWKQWWKAFFG